MLRTSDIFTCLSNSFGGETWGKLFYLTLHYDAWKHKIKKKYNNINPLTPNDHYSGRTATLTTKVAFYILIQQI